MNNICLIGSWSWGLRDAAAGDAVDAAAGVALVEITALTLCLHPSSVPA